MLILQTLARRIVLLLVVFLVWAPAANAWSWPIQGPVLRAFSYDEAHSYAAGQHRGVDIGADAAGEAVVAPAAGTVSFAGTVPTSGKSVTIQTADGYAVTLTHLGSILVAKGASLAEQDDVGTVGPSGTPELDGPYVHLGIRVAADPNGYVDPVGLLPAASDGGGTSTSDPTTTQPASTGASSSPSTSQPGTSTSSSTATASEPAASAPSSSRGATTRGSTVAPHRHAVSAHEHARTHNSRTESQPQRTSHPQAGHAVVTPRSYSGRPKRPVQRPVVETVAPVESTGLDTGHENRPGEPVVQPAMRSHQPADTRLALLCNGAAALVALCAAFAVGRRRRRWLETSPIAAAEVLPFPQPTVERRAA